MNKPSREPKDVKILYLTTKQLKEQYNISHTPLSVSMKQLNAFKPSYPNEVEENNIPLMIERTKPQDYKKDPINGYTVEGRSFTYAGGYYLLLETGELFHNNILSTHLLINWEPGLNRSKRPVEEAWKRKKHRIERSKKDNSVKVIWTFYDYDSLKVSPEEKKHLEKVYKVDGSVTTRARNIPVSLRSLLGSVWYSHLPKPERRLPKLMYLKTDFHPNVNNFLPEQSTDITPLYIDNIYFRKDINEQAFVIKERIKRGDFKGMQGKKTNRINKVLTTIEHFKCIWEMANIYSHSYISRLTGLSVAQVGKVIDGTVKQDNFDQEELLSIRKSLQPMTPVGIGIQRKIFLYPGDDPYFVFNYFFYQYSSYNQYLIYRREKTSAKKQRTRAMSFEEWNKWRQCHETRAKKNESVSTARYAATEYLYRFEQFDNEYVKKAYDDFTELLANWDDRTESWKDPNHPLIKSFDEMNAWVISRKDVNEMFIKNYKIHLDQTYSNVIYKSPIPKSKRSTPKYLTDHTEEQLTETLTPIQSTETTIVTKHHDQFPNIEDLKTHELYALYDESGNDPEEILRLIQHEQQRSLSLINNAELPDLTKFEENGYGSYQEYKLSFYYPLTDQIEHDIKRYLKDRL